MSRASRRWFRPLVKLWVGVSEREGEGERGRERIYEIITKLRSVSHMYTYRYLQASLKVMSQHIEIHLVKMFH
jgi:hypothetical protein